MRRFLGENMAKRPPYFLKVETYAEPGPDGPIFSMHLSYFYRRYFWRKKKLLYELETPRGSEDEMMSYVYLVLKQLPYGFDQEWIQAQEMAWVL